VKKTFTLFAVVFTASFIACAVVGLIWFPYAPYHEAEGTFVDKTGQPHSEADFRRFQLWERSLIVTGIGFAVSTVVRVIYRSWLLKRLNRQKGDILDGSREAKL
jgi:hypothetical protein